ncbi:NAD-dependent protein deacetylase of SIR2 family [Marinobacter nitratireducens]|uniref:protein acetyllysine N-acetyltransferase n=1 Tax=Marinobacter nitratireducens TaxID=1137280 RepID=A0A072N162_9GAMM|nr:NAD-dependent protein deacetylase [Marinobacter nitratireducens]KEF31419.1 NAD-dependent protein deacetylase of SIR2 family [Marinobacter nitratireducens]TNF00276.1 MAG: NAD-dependent protein deacetylase [Gammaproteobacteria bacterium]
MKSMTHRVRPFASSQRLPDIDEPLARHDPEEAADQLAAFIRRHPRLMILTGAGVSTDSGIPDYRDGDGAWKRKQPVQHQAFMGSFEIRQRYWGRSLIGWPVMQKAAPNPSHHYISELEQAGHSRLVVTQNVDRLHQRAGTQAVLDLHGRADEVLCMDCGYRCSRDEVHERCADLNPGFLSYQAGVAPDGDADLDVDFSDFRLADCPTCKGILKPDVVFFGDFVPKSRVQTALDALKASDGLLVIGSSLMVYSGFRFCRYGKEWEKPMATLNLGRTRAEDLVDLKLNARIGETLQATLRQLR